MNNNQGQKPNLSAWQDPFISALEKKVAEPHSTLNDLIEITFQKGILNRLCPLIAQ